MESALQEPGGQSGGEVNSHRVIVGFYYQEKEWILGGQTTNVILVSPTGQQQIIGVNGFGIVSWFLIPAFLPVKLRLPSLCYSQA